ncbi:MAG: hydroxypyruvate [Gallionellaceae bacterium]|nr:MAG: hydroxypyruvate [Gallionellaceae bacterium]
MTNTIIFSDLDGTLLDPVTYSHREACPALSRVHELHIPLILCSSKTRAEIEVCRQRLDNTHPFISENGGGIFIPKGYFKMPIEASELNGYLLITLGTPYAEILRNFSSLRRRFPVQVRGFADMSTEEVSKLTGLSLAEAVLAKHRDFDEPFVFEGAPSERFLQAIESSNLRWTQGRLFHIMGNHDKGRAVSILKALYEHQFGSVVTVGIGDSLNDLPMLRVVDRPVLIRHADGSFDNRIAISNLIKTQRSGPAGWNETVLQLLAQTEVEKPPFLPVRKEMERIFNSALAAVDPFNAVLNTVLCEHNQLRISETKYELSKFERIIVIGAGKATARMALAVESLLGEKISAGLIVVKDGHMQPLSIIRQVEAAHPIPNRAGIEGTQSILQMARDADEKTLVVCLLSGGASALLVSPSEGVTLRDKQEVTRMLLNAGASIAELNAVRKHLSSVKGGKLAQAAYPAPMLTLILSDVIGDPVDVIASGPTAPDSSTFAEAWAVVLKYGLLEKLPQCVADLLQRGMEGRAVETAKANDLSLSKTRNVIIASITQALAAAQTQSEQLGFTPKIISAALQGEACDAAHFLAQAAHVELMGMKPGERHCLLCGGETTVTVRGNGKGGRNQEFTLAFASEIEGLQGVSLLSAATDGTDGPTDAAGAVVDSTTAAHARRMGMDPLSYLERNDSYAFFQKFDDLSGGYSHFKTGPTGTNVMDIQIVLLNKQELPSAQPDIIS